MNFQVVVLGFMLCLEALAALPTPEGIYRSVLGTTLYTHQGALVRDIPFDPVHGLFQTLENQLNIKLKNRGEAHITVVTPPEFESAFKAHFSKNEWEEMARYEIPQIQFKLLCVGIGQVNEMKTVYLVADSPDALSFRARLRDELVRRGGDPKSFNPDDFYPHITAGFTHRDLHIQDGVIKDRLSCLSEYYFE